MIGLYCLYSSIHDEATLKNNSQTFINEITFNSNVKFQEVDNLHEFPLNVIYVMTGGVEGLFRDLYRHEKGPFILLASPSNNSLAAAMEILSFLRARSEKAEIVHGEPSYVIERLGVLEKVFETISGLNHTILGVVGKPSDWLIASEVDYDKVKHHLGVELKDISVDELVECSKTDHQFVDNEYLLDVKAKKYNEVILQGAIEIYHGLLTLIDKYHLQGLTVRCFDLLDKLKNTSCLGLALLNSQNIVGTCEGDIPSMLSMYILSLLTSSPGFQANPAKINPTLNEIQFAHCTVPFKMVYSYSLDSHFESGLGVAIKGEIKEDVVTIFKLSADLHSYYLTTGRITGNTDNKNLCRTQIIVKLDSSSNYFLTNPLGNHHVIVLGDKKKEIECFMRYSKLNAELVK